MLDRLVAAGEITLAIDRRKLSNMDFPLALEADGNRWIYPVLACASAGFWFGGLAIGATISVLGIALYLTLGRAVVVRKLDRRVRERGLRSLESWRQIWRFGGVILTRTGYPDCQGPGGNWMALVRAATEMAVR